MNVSFAVHGHAPRFVQPVHVGRPNLPDRDRFFARVGAAFDRAWLTNDGPLLRELEGKLAGRLGAAHCVAMANGTAAMEVLTRALGLSGDVVMPAFTFVATAHAFSWLGLRPVFCDVEADTHTLDARAAAAMLTPATRAVTAVHLWGNACDTTALQRVTDAHGVPLIYDAAHAFATETRHGPVGGFGAAEVFSFHATKFFNTMEGGAVTTNDDALARELRLMRNFGFRGYDDVARVGTNAKLNEVCAAAGLTLLEDLDVLLDRNRERFAQYDAALSGLPGIRVVRPERAARSNHQYVTIEVGSGAPLTRDQLLAVLWAENVRARRYFFPGCHAMNPYRANPAGPLPVTERLVREVLVLPAGAATSEADAAAVCELVRAALEHADTLRAVVPAELPPGGLPA